MSGASLYRRGRRDWGGLVVGVGDVQGVKSCVDVVGLLPLGQVIQDVLRCVLVGAVEERGNVLVGEIQCVWEGGAREQMGLWGLWDARGECGGDAAQKSRLVNALTSTSAGLGNDSGGGEDMAVLFDSPSLAQ